MHNAYVAKLVGVSQSRKQQDVNQLQQIGPKHDDLALQSNFSGSIAARGLCFWSVPHVHKLMIALSNLYHMFDIHSLINKLTTKASVEESVSNVLKAELKCLNLKRYPDRYFCSMKRRLSLICESHKHQAQVVTAKPETCKITTS